MSVIVRIVRAVPSTGQHLPFSIANRLGNPPVRAILRSPLHPLLSRRLAVVSYSGRKSGNVYSIPTEYRRRDDAIVIPVGWPARKRWWRNFREPHPITVRVRGEEIRGDGQAVEKPSGAVYVRVEPHNRPTGGA